jgi:hypothetical protein
MQGKDGYHRPGPALSLSLSLSLALALFFSLSLSRSRSRSLSLSLFLSLSLSLSLSLALSPALSLSFTHTGAKRVYAGVDDGAGWHKFYGQMITVLSLSPTLEHSFTGRGDFVLFGNCCVPIAVVVVA